MAEIPGRDKVVIMGRSGQKSKKSAPEPGREDSGAPSRPRTQPSSAPLRFISESSLPALDPGDILLLDGALAARQAIEPAFLAVLACPRCGAPRLITAAQLFGSAAVVCADENCSALYRIVDQRAFVYLPVN